MLKREKLFYIYIILGFILNIFIFPIGGLNFLKSALTALTDLDNNVEVKKVVIESDGYADKTPGSWHMEKSADWTSTTNAKIVFDVNTNPSFHEVPSLDVIMVLDVSGSMSGTKMDKLKESAKKYVNDVLSLDESNTIALVKYASEASVVTSFVNDADNLITDIDGLEASGNTNYYAGLKKIEELLTDYETSQDRGLVVLFMTDGAANEDTSMIKSQYEYLKEKYHDMLIVGIQYEMGSKITEYLKQASDIQYDAYMGDIYDNFFTATFSGLLDYYEKFEIVDYIDNTYFEVLSEDDIKISIGSVKLETNESSQKVIWTIETNRLMTGTKLHMEINAKLKKEYQDKVDYYPTNKGVEVTTKLPDEEEKYTESNKTPVLKYGYIVYYDGNYPSECDMTYNTEEYHYFHEVVELADVPPVCEGYQFTGWKIKGVIEKVSDTSFSMPEREVYIKGTWGRAELVKSTEGTIYVAPPPTLYNVMKEQSVPDNITSAYVTNENGIDFTTDSSSTNGRGAYMIADTAGDEYPIYYYRGAVDNNNVLFAKICWKMVRTTETGGVKLIYSGLPIDQDGKTVCSNTGRNSWVTTKEFNTNRNSLTYVGYKYGKVYPIHATEFSNKFPFISQHKSVSRSKVSNTISYDEATGKYTLVNAQSQTTHIVTNKYTCFSNTSTTCADPGYIVGHRKVPNTSSSYYHYYVSSKQVITIGTNISDNGDGTYSLVDKIDIGLVQLHRERNKYRGAYYCYDDATGDSCSKEDLHRIYVEGSGIIGLITNNYLYGNDIQYDEGTKTYKLLNVKSPYDLDFSLSTYRYTCLDENSDTCSSVRYIISYGYGYRWAANPIYYITLTDGKTIDDALDEMSSNETNSVIKDYVENDWYANNMKDYTDYLEDTGWCNDRGMIDKTFTSYNSSILYSYGTANYSQFNTFYRKYYGTPSLKCRKQDELTVSNNGVTYPVGLITTDELIYSGTGGSYLKVGYDYWTMSPARVFIDVIDNTITFTIQSYSSDLEKTIITSALGVRPVISLKNGTMYEFGDGTEENPYLVVTN